MPPEKPSGYRMGWLLVMFDLPVMTKKQRMVATKFRNNLLDRGYLMLQYSVYGRCAVTLERKDHLVNELEQIAPPSGRIRCFFITDAQWGRCVVLHKDEKRIRFGFGKNEPDDQLQFW